MNAVKLGFIFSFICVEGFFLLRLIFWEKVNFCVKCSEMVFFEPKCHKNVDFKVTFFFAFFASFSLRRIFFAQNAKKIFFAKNLQSILRPYVAREF